MTSLDELRNKDAITTGEGLEVSFRLCEKYLNVLNNILRIKQQMPEDGGGFTRVTQGNTPLLEALRDTLVELETSLKQIEIALTEKNQ